MIGVCLAIQIIILLGMFSAQYISRELRENRKFEIDNILKITIHWRGL